MRAQRRHLALLFATLVVATSDVGAAQQVSGSIAVSPDGTLLAVTNADSGSVSLLPLPELRTVTEIEVGRTPMALAFSADSERLFVALTDENAVSIVDFTSEHRLTRLDLPDAPFGLVAGAEDRLFVSMPNSDAIGVFDLSTRTMIEKLQTEPSPAGLALDEEGNRLFVTHRLTGRLSIFDAETLAHLATVSTGPDSNIALTVVLDTERSRAYLPLTRSNSASRSLVFDATVFPAVAVIDTDKFTSVRSEAIALDIVDRPVGLPIAAAVRPGTNELWIVNAASNDLSVVEPGKGSALANIEVGDNPRGIAIEPSGERVFVDNALAGTISVIDAKSYSLQATFPVTDIQLAASILEGKRLFNSSAGPELARDSWIACATCHFDGGMDGRTWFFRDGPRNTPALFGVAETLPLHWSGDLDELQDVEHTIRTIQSGTGLVAGEDYCLPSCDQGPKNAGRSEALDNLAAYLATLAPPPPPVAVDAEAVARGAEIFNSQATRCATCHVRPTFTDRRRHDVGTGGSPLEMKGTMFDTPSLRGVRLTAPYFHDGSAPDLRELLARSTDGLHGDTSTLDAAQLDELVAYLESI